VHVIPPCYAAPHGEAARLTANILGVQIRNHRRLASHKGSDEATFNHASLPVSAAIVSLLPVEGPAKTVDYINLKFPDRF
jgi:hypothetical protein